MLSGSRRHRFLRRTNGICGKQKRWDYHLCIDRHARRVKCLFSKSFSFAWLSFGDRKAWILIRYPMKTRAHAAMLYLSFVGCLRDSQFFPCENDSSSLQYQRARMHDLYASEKLTRRISVGCYFFKYARVAAISDRSHDSLDCSGRQTWTLTPIENFHIITLKILRDCWTRLIECTYKMAEDARILLFLTVQPKISVLQYRKTSPNATQNGSKKQQYQRINKYGVNLQYFP